VAVPFVAACSGSSSSASPAGSSMIPRAPMYTCSPELPDSDAGCRAPTFYANAPKDTNRYPAGCMVTLPVASGFNPAAPLQCTCETAPVLSPDGGALAFVCPD
jgi:hypothetical protein